jgi:hypothetical protein
LAISTIKFTQGDVEDEEDKDTIFLNTSSAPDLGIETGVAPNVGLAIAVDALLNIGDGDLALGLTWPSLKSNR